MQEGDAERARERPLAAEVHRVAEDHRLHFQLAGPVFPAVRRGGLGRQDGGIGEVALAEGHRDRVAVGVLAVDEAVGGQAHVVHQPGQVERAVQRGGVAEDRVVLDRGEVLGDVVVAQIVGQGVGDAQQVTLRAHVEPARLEHPAIAEVVPELAEAGVGDQVGAGAGLAVADAGRIDRRRQEGALAAEVDDAARQSRGVGFIVAGVQLEHGVLAQMDVEVALGQGAVHAAAVDVALALAMQHVQSKAEGAHAVANIGLSGENALRVEAADGAHQRNVGGTLGEVVEHPGGRLRAEEGAGDSVHHLDAAQALAGHGGGADHVQSVQAGVLDDAALEAARLRPRDLEALLIPDLHRRQVAQGVIHRARLQVDDQVFRHGGHRHRRVQDRTHAERA